MPQDPSNRRDFIKRTAALAAVPLILPSRVWSQATAPSRRLTIGCIGTGRIMQDHLSALLPRDEVEVLAVCDVDTTRREDALHRVEEAYSAKTGSTYRACTVHNDFREVLDRDDIDAVFITTPDHWHAYIAIAAARAGKDIYCEKPLTYNVHEAVELVNAVRQTNVVFQTGSLQRSMKEFRIVSELVRNGVLGPIHSVHISVGGPPTPIPLPAEPLEPGLDWNRWCGPGPLVPYNSVLSPRGVHHHWPQWRNTWEFGGGQVTDWGAHHIDIAHWALGVDGSGPVETRAPKNWETAERGAQLIYANGAVLTHVKGRGVSIYGTEGEVHVHREKYELMLNGRTVHRFWNRNVDTETSLNRELALTEREYLADAKVKLIQSSDHIQNFLDAVRTRGVPVCDVTVGASSVIACHLMNMSYHYGANVKWDPARNQFISGGDPRWLTREDYRDGWVV